MKLRDTFVPISHAAFLLTQQAYGDPVILLNVWNFLYKECTVSDDETVMIYKQATLENVAAASLACHRSWAKGLQIRW